MKKFIQANLSGRICLVCVTAAVAQGKAPAEDDYYRIVTIPTPEGALLEVGGVATLPDGRIAVCYTTRRCMDDRKTLRWKTATPLCSRLFASGLHEPLGWRTKTMHSMPHNAASSQSWSTRTATAKPMSMKQFIHGRSPVTTTNTPSVPRSRPMEAFFVIG